MLHHMSFQRLIYTTLAAVWLLLVVAWWQVVMDRAAPSVINLESAQPVEVVAGQEVRVEYSVARLRACTVRGERVLQGAFARSIIYPIYFGERIITEEDVGKQVSTVAKFKIPLDIEPGYYYFYSRLTYECNTMQKFFPILMETPRLLIRVS